MAYASKEGKGTKAMKRTLIVLLMLTVLFAGFPATATIEPETDTPLGSKLEIKSVSIGLEVWSEYLIDGFDFSDGPVVQRWIGLELVHGLYAEVWMSTGTNDDELSSDFADEIDYTLGWFRGGEKVDLNVGVSYWDLFELGESEADLLQFYAIPSITREYGLHTLNPFVKFEYLFAIDWPAPDDNNGWQVNFGTKHSWQPHVAFRFDHEASVWYDGGIVGSDPGWFLSYKAGPVWIPNARWEVRPLMVKASLPLDDDPVRENEIVVGSGMTFTF